MKHSYLESSGLFPYLDIFTPRTKDFQKLFPKFQDSVYGLRFLPPPVLLKLLVNHIDFGHFVKFGLNFSSNHLKIRISKQRGVSGLNISHFVGVQFIQLFFQSLLKLFKNTTVRVLTQQAANQITVSWTPLFRITHAFL